MVMYPPDMPMTVPPSIESVPTSFAPHLFSDLKVMGLPLVPEDVMNQSPVCPPAVGRVYVSSRKLTVSPATATAEALAGVLHGAARLPAAASDPVGET